MKTYEVNGTVFDGRREQSISVTFATLGEARNEAALARDTWGDDADVSIWELDSAREALEGGSYAPRKVA